MTEKKKIDTRLREILTQNRFSFKDILERQREIIPLSPYLNYMFGGGLASGSFSIVTGKQKLGKTATCLHIAKKAQGMGYNVIYLDCETRVTDRDFKSSRGIVGDITEQQLEEQYGINSENFQVYSSDINNILSAEDYMKIAQHQVSQEQKCIVIADSVSMMCPRELMDGDIGDKFRDPSPALLSRFCKVMLPHVSVTNNMFVAITHLMANTSGMGFSTTTEASGGKIQYAENFKIKMTHTKDIEDKKTGKKIGLNLHANCINTSIGVAGRNGVLQLMFDRGIDEVAETIHFAKDIGGTESFKVRGSWVTVGEEKFQGLPSLLEYMRSSPDVVEKIRQEIANKVNVDHAI